MSFNVPTRRLLTLAIVPLLLVVVGCDNRKAPSGDRPVIVYGDSLAWQARSPLEFLGHANGVNLKVRAAGGIAACDQVASVRQDLAAAVKPRAIVLEFWGNNLTPCMGAPRSGAEGFTHGTSAYFDPWRSSLDAIQAAAAEAGVPVLWAAAPPRHYSDVDPDLNEVFEGMARRRGWQVIPAGDVVADPAGRWVRRLPCNDFDVASGNCRNGVVEVRDADHVHFAEGTDGSWPGAVRWAGEVVAAVM